MSQVDTLIEMLPRLLYFALFEQDWCGEYRPTGTVIDGQFDLVQVAEKLRPAITRAVMVGAVESAAQILSTQPTQPIIILRNDERTSQS